MSEAVAVKGAPVGACRKGELYSRHGLSRCFLCLTVFAGVPAGAQQSSEQKSLIYTTARLYGGFGGKVVAAQTWYIRGRNQRFESRESREIASAQYTPSFPRCDLKYRFVLDLAAKTYVAWPLDDKGCPVPRPTRVASEPPDRTAEWRAERNS